MKKKPETLSFCKHCGEPLNKKEIVRNYGKESLVYIGGYCSSICYTMDTVNIRKDSPLLEEAMQEYRLTTEEKIHQYLKDNLRIEVNLKSIDFSNHHRLEIGLYLNDEKISEDLCTIWN